MTRRAIAAVTGAGMMIAAVAAVAARDDGTADTGVAAGSVLAKGTAKVTRTTLVEEESFDGTLGFGATRRVGPQGGPPGGTLTALATEGSTIERGGVLWEVDGRPVRLLYGERPFWRGLAEGAADGPDVRQLEENLVALGHASAKTLSVDDSFTAATTAAVKRWENALGAPEDGRLDAGEAVFLAGPVRVAARLQVAGATAAGEALEVTPVAKAVTFSLPASRRAMVEPGTQVEVELPGRSRVAATVASVATKASAPGDAGGAPQVEVVATLDDAAATEGLDTAPVEVHVVRDRAENVLAVPVSALLALAEGGYAVEVVAPSGAARLVPVETGTFSRGLVEVTGGGLAEGTTVAVPE